MGKFNSLLKTNRSKRTHSYDYITRYKSGHFKVSTDYDYFESLYIQDLCALNQKKKYNQDLLTLWGKLDMKSYIDYELGNTYNPYFIKDSNRYGVSELEDYNYMHEDARKSSLLDIKYIKSLTLEDITFKNLYLATYEILDQNNIFRPYVLLLQKGNLENFIEIGYGYDTNDNDNVELFIHSFNYPVFLTSKGQIILPLTHKKSKLDVYDYITDTDVEKLEK